MDPLIEFYSQPPDIDRQYSRNQRETGLFSNLGRYAVPIIANVKRQAIGVLNPLVALAGNVLKQAAGESLKTTGKYIAAQSLKSALRKGTRKFYKRLSKACVRKGYKRRRDGKRQRDILA